MERGLTWARRRRTSPWRACPSGLPRRGPAAREVAPVRRPLEGWSAASAPPPGARPAGNNTAILPVTELFLARAVDIDHFFECWWRNSDRRRRPPSEQVDTCHRLTWNSGVDRLLCSAGGGRLLLVGEAEGEGLLRPRWGGSAPAAPGGPGGPGGPDPGGPLVLRLVSARVLNRRFLLVGMRGSPASPWAARARSHWYESGDELSTCSRARHQSSVSLQDKV